MEKQVIWRDFQQVTSTDLNNLQGYAKQSFDDVVHDAVTASLRYSGFQAAKTNQAEITVQPGRFYGTNASGQVGAVFALPVATIMSLVQYLAVAAQRYVTVVAYGVENEVDPQTRDFLINVTTLQKSPQVNNMTRSRDAVIAIVAGAEGADPQPPAVAATQVAVANVLMDTTGVVSVTMLPAGQVTSTENLDERLDDVETFDNQIAPRVSKLAADLAALANLVNSMGKMTNLIEIYQDLAEVKAKTGLPEDHSQYGADFFLWPDATQSDVNNTQALGYSALIDMGIRFPAQNADVFALTLFNPLDPNAAYNNGLLLPAYTHSLTLETGDHVSSIAIGQFTFQTYALVEQDIAYSRIRDGGSYWQCSNGVSGYTAGDTTVNWWLPNFSTYETADTTITQNIPGHVITTTDYFWHDTWTEPYWSLDTVNHSINGAQIAQSFLVSNDMWVTKLGIWIDSVASATDLYLTLVKCTNGAPDLTQAISHNVIAGADLVQGWNELAIVPAFASKGDRMAVVVTSNANHQIGTTAGGTYLDGTLFFSLDGAYQLGDFTKELMLRVYSAKFNSSQVAIEFGALNLQGGIRDIDLTSRMIVPASCQLVFEVLPDGGGTWLPLGPDAPLAPFQNAPVLARFRGRFVGTPDIAAGIKLTDSICNIWCPGPTFRHVSHVETLAAASTNISVKLTVENFNPTPHTCGVRLWYGASFKNPATTTTELIDATEGRYEITAVFSGIPSTTTFTIVIDGTTNSVADVFHVAERLFWST